MKAAIRDAMCRRFSDINSSAPFLAATLLDPRFKDTYFNAQDTAAAKKVVLDFLHSVEESAKSTIMVPDLATDNVGSGPECSETSDAKDEDNLWSAHDNHNANVDPSVNNECQPDSIPLYEQQLINYLNEQRLPRMTTDIYAYWHCSQYLVSVSAKTREFTFGRPLIRNIKHDKKHAPTNSWAA
jgi:hypothetical protein